MSVDRKALAAALAALLLVGACGGSATPTPAPSQAPAPSQGAAASEEPAASAEASASEEATETPSEAPAASQAAGAAGDLAATLPSTVKGVTFTKATIPGGIIPGGIPIGPNEGDFGKFLADNGRSLSDVNIATATAAGASAIGTMVMAIQVKGVPADKLLALFTQGSGDMPQTTVGGKQVYGAAAAGFGAYLYPKNDAIYYVLSMGGDASMAAAILGQLP